MIAYASEYAQHPQRATQMLHGIVHCVAWGQPLPRFCESRHPPADYNIPPYWIALPPFHRCKQSTNARYCAHHTITMCKGVCCITI